MSALSSATRMRGWRGPDRGGRRRLGLRRVLGRRQPAHRLLDVGLRRAGGVRGPAVRLARAPRAGGRGRAGGGPSNALPSAGRLSTAISPPCSRTRSLTSARPMPEPSWVRARAPVHAVEPLEEPRELVRRDAGAGVAHPEHDARRPRAQRARRTAPCERELQRVGEQVQHDLLPHVPVDVDRLRQRRAVDLEAAARRARTPSGTSLARSRVSWARSVGSEASRRRGRPRGARTRAAS